ncbi:hypothetical protein [Rhizobium sp. FKY42]|uniref:hypothetical protein n=1 Tax=Rhizobium sp. FKY42 TaxID=2562310 RepID=UPI0010C07708|nr:hypothetical protein [Rhizobium sp. FKY42]
MVTVADARRYLGNHHTEDAEIQRLLDACISHLSSIGVQVDPMPLPVREAVYLMVSVLHSRTDHPFGRSRDEVEGIGSYSYFSPKLIDDANWQVIRLLTDPHREVSL